MKDGKQHYMGTKKEKEDFRDTNMGIRNTLVTAHYLVLMPWASML